MYKARRLTGNKVKKWVLGNQKKHGIIPSIIMYTLLFGLGFVFIYPLLSIFSTSTKNIYDLVNPMVKWVPETFYWENFAKAYRVMGGMKVVIQSLILMGLLALIQTLVAAWTGYGLAKFTTWGKSIVMAFIIAMFLIPSDLLFLPQSVLYNTYKINDSLLPVILPTLFGQGLKSTVFIFIFYQFFRLSPKSLDEAAQIDGAGYYKTFWSINLHMATPAIVVSSILSFVWNWNDTDTAGRYFGRSFKTLALALAEFKTAYASQFPFDNKNNPLLRMNEGVEMAGTILSIIPLIILYLILERKLVESIDRTGITGE